MSQLGIWKATKWFGACGPSLLAMYWLKDRFPNFEMYRGASDVIQACAVHLCRLIFAALQWRPLEWRLAAATHLSKPTRSFATR